ncbi:LytR C-terminal domain-containing protein [Herminiimonas sp. CN]|uniref:LytR C-terminal domain-containing protein n=1 Tax=Herminiimonas sp. CN TaxID=1349818 RepID=UPI0005553D32|nr:LytR C-terminal domain-containing protein [Herminiimonas sp. CN]
MKLVRIMLPLVCSVPVLLGCSAPAVAPTTAATELKVQPLLRIRDSAGSARDFYQLGRFYQGQNRFAQAAEAYRRALEYHKDDIEARNALATTYSAQGRLNEAIAEFETILKVTPQLAHLHNNLGYAYYLQNNFDKAIAAFETAIALEPRNPRAYNNLGLVYRKRGDAEKSRLAFARAADLNSGSAIAGAPPEAVAAPAAAGSIASIAPSIALHNNAPRIDLQPPSSPAAALPPTGEWSEASRYAPSALTAASPAKPASPLLAPASLAQKVLGSITLSTKGLLTETNGAISAAAPVIAVPQENDSVVAVFAVDTPFRFEIANGNGITGLARKVRATLVQQGLPTSHLTNLKPYRTLETTIQYRSGFHDAALRLGRTLSKPATLVGNDHLRPGADVQLVLGKDATSTMALFRADIGTVKLAKEVVKQGDAG